MDNYDFLKVFSGNTYLYICVLLFLSLLYYIIFRKDIYSIIDPLFLTIVYSVFAASVVFLLYFTGNVSNYIFSNFCLTELSLIAGFFSLKKVNLFKTRRLVTKNFVESDYSKSIFFVITSFLFIVIQLYTYWQRGIPLFYKSRLEYFEGGAGFGIFSRILSVLTVVSLYTYFDLLFNRRVYTSLGFFFYSCSYALMMFASLVLSGSKSSFLLLAYVFFAYYFINGKMEYFMKIWRKWRLLVLLSAFGLVLGIIAIQRDPDEAGLPPLLMLGYRLVSSGDIFWYSYPHDLVFSYPYHINGFEMLFNDMLGFLRIYSWDELKFHPGEYFYKYHHYSDITQGANARHNLFGLLYFGYGGSLVFSFIMGAIISIFRYQLPKFGLYKGVFVRAFICYMYLKALSVVSDPTLFFSNMDDMLIIIVPVLLLYLIADSFFRARLTYEHM